MHDGTGDLDNNTLHLMYYRARSYDPETGRFMQRDPLGVNPAGKTRNLFGVHKQYEDSVNVYEYVSGNPIRMRDPYGLVKFDSKSCFCGSSNWHTKQKRDKFRTMMASMNKACDNVDSIGITDPDRVNCIKKRCKDKKVICRAGSGMRGEAAHPDWWKNVIFYPDQFDYSGIYNDSSGVDRSAGDVLIHEYAHTCGWNHAMNKGVPQVGDRI